ncbi:MAG TPA: hypothetical protein VF792_11290 [Ktedonobacterales bacterium]
MEFTSEEIDAPTLRESIASVPPRFLLAVRGGWIALCALSLTLYIAMTPAYFAGLQQVCASGCQLTPGQARALIGLGFSARSYAMGGVVVSALFVLVSCGVAALIFWRTPYDWMALLVGLLLVTLGNNNITSLLGNTSTFWRVPATVIDNVDLALLVLVFTLFPNGRFIPRWTATLAPLWLVIQLPVALLPSGTLPDWSVALIYLAFFATVIGAQIYRYRRVSGLVQRVQTKWVVFGVVVTLLVDIAIYQPYAFVPALSAPDALYPILAEAFFHLVVLLIPLSFGVAILRYRLYDIDVIINRAAVYGMLTTTLAAVYLGLVIAVQRVVSLFAHANSSSLAIVLSTLAISALFQPLRSRIQTFIDRRFFRSKYDAAKTLATFSATLRSEVDLTEMRSQLRAVVERTMRPAHVSLWLAPYHPSRTPHNTEEALPAQRPIPPTPT